MMEKIKCRYCSKLFVDEVAASKHRQETHPEFVSDSSLGRLAKSAIWDFLSSDGTDKGLRERAKQAGGYLSTEARREQSQSAKDATMVMMARELASDKEQFREYLRLALPNTPMLKALPKS